MDSITQAALGASVAYVVAGRVLGRRALVLGAALGSLPDLDVIVPYDDAVAGFTYHRSWSHSYFVLSTVAVVLAVVLRKWFDRQELSLKRSFVMLWLVLITHPLLDSFTVYGTQVLWPLSDYPVAWGTIFIIDPLFTLPMLIAICFVLLEHAKVGSSCRGSMSLHACQRKIKIGLAFSLVYLSLTVALYFHVHARVMPSLAERGISSDRYLVLPTPGSVLWRVVGRNSDHYLEAFHSLRKPGRTLDFMRFDTRDDLLTGLSDYPPVERLIWFTRGFFATSLEDNVVVISDLRMGVEAQYVFRFNVGRYQPDTQQVKALVPTVLQRFQPNPERMKWVLQQF